MTFVTKRKHSRLRLVNRQLEIKKMADWAIRMPNLPKKQNVKRKHLLAESTRVRVAFKKDERLLAYFAKMRLKVLSASDAK